MKNICINEFCGFLLNVDFWLCFWQTSKKDQILFHEIIFIGLTLQIIFEAFFQTKNAWRRRNSSMYLQIKSLLLKEIVLAKWRHFDILGVVTCPKNRCYTAHYLRFNVPLMSWWDVCQYFYASDFSKDTRTHNPYTALDEKWNNM